MNIYTTILVIFLIGPTIALVVRFLWNRHEKKLNNNMNRDHSDCDITKQKEYPMARKPVKSPKKVKMNEQSISRREMIHLDYLNVYNEVLKYEEVLDLDIDIILEATKTVFSNELSLSKLATSPTQEELEVLVKKVLEHLDGLKLISKEVHNLLQK